MFCVRCVCAEVTHGLRTTGLGFEGKHACKFSLALCVSVLDRPCEVWHHQVSCSGLWQPSVWASAVLSTMHRYSNLSGNRLVLWVRSLPVSCDDVLSADEPRIPAGLRASVKSCRYNGSIYQPGETFTKHDLFPSKQSNQCVMCTCSVSNICFATCIFGCFLILWKYPELWDD